MDKSQAYFVKSCEVLSSRLVHILVYARTGKTVSSLCSPTFDRRDYFSLRVEEIGDVTAFLNKNIQNLPPTARELTVDFLMCIDGSYLPMESWCVSVSDVGETIAHSFDFLDQNGDPMLSFDPDKFSSEVGNLLKASIAAARATPMFRYFIKKPESERHIVLYRVFEGPPIIDLGEGQQHCHIGNVCTLFGNISLDAYYRTEFETCKTSCCSHDVFGEESSERQVPSSKRGLEDNVGAYFPFGPAKRSSRTGFGTDKSPHDSRGKNLNNINPHKDPSSKRPFFYLEKKSFSNDSNASNPVDSTQANRDNLLPDSRQSDAKAEVPVPFLALLTASCTENCLNDQLSLQEEKTILPKSKSDAAAKPLSFKKTTNHKQRKGDFFFQKKYDTDATIYESGATVVLSSSNHSVTQDPKVSNYSFLSSDDESNDSQADNTSDNSFIKVPSALLPTGDPSNVGDFILFLRRCEMQEFTFASDRTDSLVEQLAQFEVRKDSFDQFLANITEMEEI